MHPKIPENVTCDNFIKGAWVKGDQGTVGINSPYNGKKIGQSECAFKKTNRSIN